MASAGGGTGRLPPLLLPGVRALAAPRSLTGGDTGDNRGMMSGQAAHRGEERGKVSIAADPESGVMRRGDMAGLRSAPAVTDHGLPSGRYLDREESWLRFNQRVLELAEDESLPLLERVRF